MAESVSDSVKGGNNKNHGIENLISARKALKVSLEKSKSLALALERAGPRLDDINQRLPSLEAAVRPIRADKDALVAVGGHINRAVGPAAAVLKVFDAVHGLEKSLLSDPRNDLPGYLSVLKRLEEALRFLGDNCGLAIQWLEDIVEYLEDNRMADEKYLLNLKKSLKGLRELENGEVEIRLDGGLLDAALDKLESDFRKLLTENSVPLPMSSPSTLGQQACIAPSPLPVSVIHKLQAILGRLIANNRFDKCISVYVEVRSSNVRASLQALDLDYLEISIAEFNDVQSIEGYIAQWGRHLEFAVKHLFEAEYNLCNDVFERMGKDIWMGCFAKIAAQAGMLAFLQFACVEIQNLTRDLINRVINGAAEIFGELLTQVELQRQIPPPPDGSVPRLVLVIHRSWKHEKFQEKLLVNEVLKIVKAIEQNLETWLKAYDDTTLSHFFAMNNHCHLYKSLKGTKLGDLLGDSWLREHEQYKDYYSTIFFRDSWGKIPSHLSREGLIMFSGGRASARDLVKKRLKAFNDALDDVYKKQSNWVILDKDLREKTSQLITQAIAPIYRSYMQNYGALVEQEASSGKYAKYTVETLEKMLGSLFQPKPGRYGSFKGRSPAGKFDNGMADLRRTASAVV
ncbi:exocyst subunit exo70 family protein [Citrus sinensis]|uniref:Exocyst subunit exo70 family protein n=1 Tax=Citrus sinensis TaxID=2711 RepID=A0ACB8NM02_CITSI|nr:exocyst subunit exo70 family protein [Citrus sinensis]